MKKVLITFIFFLHFSVNGQILQKKVTLSYSGISIEAALNEITEAYHVDFSYSKDILPLDKQININIKDQSLDDALKAIFKETDILFSVIGEQVVLKREEKKPFKKTAQNISGKVVDETTGDPLSFASVSVEGKNIGIVTNLDGEFILNLPYNTDDTLKVSFIGYKSEKRSLGNLKNNTTIIPMQKDVIELEMVVVKQQSALSILKEAISKIPKNYTLTPYYQQLYLRDWTWMEGEPIQLTESIYKAYRGDVRDRELKKQLHLVEGRKIRNDRKYAEILKAFPALNSFDMGSSAYFAFQSDMTRLIEEDDFLGKNGLNQHKFTLAPNTNFDGREVIVIHYDQLQKNRSLYKGSIYLDARSLAFIKIIQYRSPKGIDQASIFGPRVLEKIFGLGENILTNQSFTIQYKEINGKWYLDYFTSEQEAYLIKTKRKFNKVVRSKSDIVVTDIRTENVQPFPDSVVMSSQAIKFRQFGEYDEEFWQEQNLIKADKHFNKAFERLWSKKGFNKKDNDLLASISATSDSMEELDNKTGELHYADLNLNQKTKHFNFLFTKFDSAIISKLDKKLEENYQRILDDFKVKKLPEIEIKIYPSIETYHSALNNPNAPDWMVGSAGINKIEMVSPQNPGPYHSSDTAYIEGIVHEFTHCVHIHMMNNSYGAVKNNDTRWLWEAVACYQANQYVELRKLDYLVNLKSITLEDLNDVENGKIYELGYHIVEYIKAKWGAKDLLKLIKTNGDIEKVLDMNIEAFEKGFSDFLQTKLTKSQQ